MQIKSRFLRKFRSLLLIINVASLARSPERKKEKRSEKERKRKKEEERKKEKKNERTKKMRNYFSWRKSPAFSGA